ncbi:hydroxymethylglutaryl-CoA lyase [Ketobacter alkanivorans]|uniref:Hydroxymethylglutaryl-CoA lyase n=1 Tax=Ketobacter alkanivorans TaxID=1917421 RepID=A0A2K9LLE1_9GAMM|nr:hydroxymethylglutaryl-CoA lyase [Ketobacter alkanivorans]AUM13047.1 hydroxymethylglutaryl-CoA lyase [Ketobacter alkanivorans]
MREQVFINEVGLRDGLQNQPNPVSTAAKLKMAQTLLDAGVSYLEAVAFVHPKAVPQMADAVDVLAGLGPLVSQSAVEVSALVPNMKGYQRAIEHGVTSVAVVLSSTDTFNMRNLNMSLLQAKETCQQVIAQANADNIKVRAYVSGACACPYDGTTPVDVVHQLAAEMIEFGANEISIGDTIGAGNPQQINDILGPLVQQFGSECFNLHLHDTRGQALAMAWAGITQGVRRFDSSIGGLGGCPFAPGASGNVATEDLVYMLEQAGFDTGIDIQKLRSAVSAAELATGQQLGGRILQWMKSQELREQQKQSPCL